MQFVTARAPAILRCKNIIIILCFFRSYVRRLPWTCNIIVPTRIDADGIQSQSRGAPCVTTIQRSDHHAKSRRRLIGKHRATTRISRYLTAGPVVLQSVYTRLNVRHNNNIVVYYKCILICLYRVAIIITIIIIDLYTRVRRCNGFDTGVPRWILKIRWASWTVRRPRARSNRCEKPTCCIVIISRDTYEKKIVVTTFTFVLWYRSYTLYSATWKKKKNYRLRPNTILEVSTRNWFAIKVSFFAAFYRYYLGKMLHIIISRRNYYIYKYPLSRIKHDINPPTSAVNKLHRALI